MTGPTLACDDLGSGFPLLLIHGFPLNRKMWQPQLAPLAAAGYRVIAPDLPGFGDTPAPAASYSMDGFADSIVAHLDRLGIDRAAVGGMSMGGYILLDLLERYPDRIAAACFIATKSGADDEEGRARRTAMAAEAERLGTNPVIKIFAELLFAPETVLAHPELVAQVTAWMRSTNPKAIAGGLLAMRDRKDYTPQLPHLAHPALFIGGAQDRAGNPQAGEIFCAGLPNCTSHIVADAGHMVNMERPDQVNALLVAFLDEVTRPR